MLLPAYCLKVFLSHLWKCHEISLSSTLLTTILISTGTEQLETEFSCMYEAGWLFEGHLDIEISDGQHDTEFNVSAFSMG